MDGCRCRIKFYKKYIPIQLIIVRPYAKDAGVVRYLFVWQNLTAIVDVDRYFDVVCSFLVTLAMDKRPKASNSLTFMVYFQSVIRICLF